MPSLDKLNHSSYWVGNFNNLSAETSPIEQLARLASIRRAIANFVHILTGNSKIAVRFSSGKESYTDGKSVVISAESDTDTFDSRVGLALHEASHCLLTDFQFIQNITPHYDVDHHTFYGSLHPDLRRMLNMGVLLTVDQYGNDTNPRIATLLKHLRGIMHQVLNIVEDRRIDSYVYRTAPGYRAYYDAMYTEYMYSPVAANGLKNDPERRKPTIRNYLDWLTFMFAAEFERDALPGLGDMIDIVDIPNIRRLDQAPMVPNPLEWKLDALLPCEKVLAKDHRAVVYYHGQFSELWKVVNQITILILRYAALNTKDNVVSLGHGGKIRLEVGHFTDTLNNTLPNLDLPPMLPTDLEDVEFELNRIRNAVAGEVQKLKLDNKDHELQVESMEAASAAFTETKDEYFGKIPCLVVRNVTKNIMRADWFPFAASAYEELVPNAHADKGVAAGLRMGAILAHRLQVRNDPQITHYTRQDSGKIDRRLLSQLGMGINGVFKKTTVEGHNPVMLHLSIDASSSMSGLKWEKVMTVATAISFAATKINNLDVVISLRGTTASGTPMVAVVFDSRTDGLNKIRALFPMLAPYGSTPEGLCFISTLDLVTECARTHAVYFINYSDGEPMCSFTHNGKWIEYRADPAIKQTRSVISKMRQAGVKIMSYFIDSGNPWETRSREAFGNMYGQNAEYVDVRNVTQILRTLNKLLITEM